MRGETLQELTSFLQSRQFNIQPTFNGEILRFDRGGKTHNAWAVFRSFQLKDHTFYSAKIGDFATGEFYQWDSTNDLTPEELKEAKKFLKDADKKDEQEKIERQNDAAKKCEALWSRAIDRGTTAYLERKGLSKFYGARIDPDRPSNLLVSLRDVEQKLWNLQKILPEKFGNAQIDKIFMEGAKIKGLFHTIGEIFPKGRIFICEGFATGASIHEATTHAVIVAFNSGNLLPVAKNIRGAYPEAEITICGDDDQWTKKSDGTLWNVGREKAKFAAGAINASKIFPRFKNLQSRPTDFNDLSQLEGIQSVKEQILNAKAVKELESCLELTKDGKIKRPSEDKIVQTLVDFFEGEIIHQDGELFKFENTHWQHQGEENVRKIKLMLQFVSGQNLNHAQIERAYKHLLLKTPTAPKNMFQPNPFTANFLNGTLSISKMPNEHAYRREFRPHSYADYITNVIPLNYEPEKLEANFEFLHAVDRIFESDPDKGDKIKSLKELFGSCLTPLFPRIFLLVGPPGSGKSTFSILASKLISQDNLSMVEPHEFRGFHMESMLGKLVNISTDIRTNEPIDDAMMKKIEDRVPVRIDRKFKTPVMAWLPAIHIFGCNKLPPNYEGDSRAFTRRTTILEFKAFKATGHFNRNFANEVFAASPGGVLNFALEGLEMLLSNGGHFSQPASGAVALEEWQDDFDPVAQFFKDLYNNEIEGQSKLEAGVEFKIERKKMWEIFCEWHEESFNRFPRFSKNKFYRQVENKFCTIIPYAGVRYFKGVKLTESVNSKM